MLHADTHTSPEGMSAPSDMTEGSFVAKWQRTLLPLAAAAARTKDVNVLNAFGLDLYLALRTMIFLELWLMTGHQADQWLRTCAGFRRRPGPDWRACSYTHGCASHTSYGLVYWCEVV